MFISIELMTAFLMFVIVFLTNYYFFVKIRNHLEIIRMMLMEIQNPSIKGKETNEEDMYRQTTLF